MKVGRRDGSRRSFRLTLPGIVLVLLIFATRGGVGTSIDPQVIAIVTLALVTLLVVAVVVPILAVRGLVVTVESPADARVGDEVPVVVAIAGRAERVMVRVLDPESPWFHTAVPGEGEVLHRADRRGVFGLLRVEVVSGWPLGLVQVGRTHSVVLPRAVHVAPVPLTTNAAVGVLPSDMVESSRPATVVSPGDETRAVRPYVPGDPPRLVHWPTSARIGAIVVRELEPPVQVGLAVVVDLRVPPPAGAAEAAALDERVESAVARAAGIVASALHQGAAVVLCTAEEPSGSVAAPVQSITQVGRRLAAATGGQPGTPPPGWTVEVVTP